MAARIQVQQGYMKFIRLGPIKFAEQSRWSVRAPESKGMWAFPYPFYDEFFTHHKYKDLLPKRYRIEDDPFELSDEEYYALPDSYWEERHNLLNERQEWINKVGRKILKVQEFWYRGDLYAHFTPGGDIADAPMCSQDSGVQWSLMNVDKLKKNIVSSGADRSFWRLGDSELFRGWSSKDHLEVFIPEGRGKIRHRLTQAK